MPAPRFRDDQWDRICRLLSAQEGLYIRQEAATRRFVETVLWIARAGCAWRALLDGLSEDADVEWLILDSTVVRAHACAAGAKKMRETRLLAALVAAFPARSMLPVTRLATRSVSA
jgi:hypothetical protein